MEIDLSQYPVRPEKGRPEVGDKVVLRTTDKYNENTDHIGVVTKVDRVYMTVEFQKNHGRQLSSKYRIDNGRIQNGGYNSRRVLLLELLRYEDQLNEAKEFLQSRLVKGLWWNMPATSILKGKEQHIFALAEFIAALEEQDAPEASRAE